jgi:DNA (cytosine-5)-methyltransferase 1
MDPRWASEVEPYPIAVTRSRFPKMAHLGDISKISGAEIEPVDIITFGSPCQDLSTAGKQAGINEGTRSGLFIEAVRIIKEMSEATDGKYPTFALWENVTGAFSSNGGEDFRTVLEELTKIAEPDAIVPPVPKKGWAYADSYVGDGWSLAYRTFNAQYWGVPQRRRRIHLVLDLRGQRARKVLFEREGLRWHPAQSGEAWQGNPSGASGSTGAGSKTFVIDQIGGRSEFYQSSPINPTLRAAGQGAVYCLQGNCIDRAYTAGCNGKGWREGESYTLNTVDRPAVSYASGLNRKPVSGALVARITSAVGTTQDNLFLSGRDTEGADYTVRRLTPTECARLQGFPDEWGVIDKKNNFTKEELSFWKEVRNTHAAINGRRVRDYTEKQMLTWYNKLHSDSAEYKMWGNGIALPPALYCMQGMAEALNEEEDRPTKCKR